MGKHCTRADAQSYRRRFDILGCMDTASDWGNGCTRRRPARDAGGRDCTVLRARISNRHNKAATRVATREVSGPILATTLRATALSVEFSRKAKAFYISASPCKSGDIRPKAGGTALPT